MSFFLSHVDPDASDPRNNGKVIQLIIDSGYMTVQSQSCHEMATEIPK